MTNEEAIYILNNTAWLGTDVGIKVYPAVKMAIEALENQERYKWHNMKEDSNDIPEFGNVVLVATKGTDVIICKKGESIEDAIERTLKECKVSTGVGFLDEHDGWTGIDGFPMIVRPFAWKEIEEYEAG